MVVVPPHLSSGLLEQLQQLCRLTWDGSLISKSARDELVRESLAMRVAGGFNLITADGVWLLDQHRLIPKEYLP